MNWDGNTFVETKELTVPDQARAIVWAEQQLCVGFRREYNLIHSKTGAMTSLFPVGKNLPQIQDEVNRTLEAREIAETRIISINTHVISTDPKAPIWGATIFWREKVD